MGKNTTVLRINKINMNQKNAFQLPLHIKCIIDKTKHPSWLFQLTLGACGALPAFLADAGERLPLHHACTSILTWVGKAT